MKRQICAGPCITFIPTNNLMPAQKNSFLFYKYSLMLYAEALATYKYTYALALEIA